MKLTVEMKGWLVENCGVDKDAADDVFMTAFAKATLDGSLSEEKRAELMKTKSAREAESANGTLEQILALTKANAEEIAALKVGATAAPAPKAAPVEGAPEAPVGTKLFGDDSTRIEHVPASDRYSTTKSTAKYDAHTKNGLPHPFAGQPVMNGQRQVEKSSELDLARIGVWFKKSVSHMTGAPGVAKLTDHEQALFGQMLVECKFTGVVSGGKQLIGTDTGAVACDGLKLADAGISTKAVIDDITSGGLEVNPIEFDDAIIQIPRLYGEFYPFVEERQTTRGTRIEGAVISNVTMSWGGADDDEITLFNTNGFISAFDTTIHVIDGAITLGLDLLSNSPVALGAEVVRQYGEAYLAQLDRVVTVGTGTNEPVGIMVNAGTSSVPTSGGTGGTPTPGDYETLMFGVPKKYQKNIPRNRVMYGGTETTYQRARSMEVTSADARRIYGSASSSDMQDYMLNGHPFGISEDMTNSQIFYAAMPRYRMYRRQGLSFRQSTEGNNLIRNNLLLITARGRCGGQLTDGAAAAVATNAKS